MVRPIFIVVENPPSPSPLQVDREISAEKRSETIRARARFRACAAVTSALALLVSVAVILAVALSKEAQGPPPLCDSSDCLRFAFLINRALDRGVKPCDSFGRFVCSSVRDWQRRDAPPGLASRDYLRHK